MAGYRELLAIEWDDHAVACFRANFPEVPVYHGDIAKLSVADVLVRTGLKPGELDVFDGSPPCQGFSTAGKRKFGDQRNQLFREYVRLLRGLQPKAFVMENVSGMVKGSMKLIFAECLRELKASGYKVSAKVLNAAYLGVPQARERMIFLGTRNDLSALPSHPAPSTKPMMASQVHPHLAEVLCAASHAGEWRPAKSMTYPVITKALGTLKINAHFSGGHFIRTIDGVERRPTLAEIQAIGSFPPAFVFPGTREQGIERIGNSVPPLLMRAIASHVRDRILRPQQAAA